MTTAPNTLAPLRVPPLPQVLKRAPWTVRLNDPVYDKRNVKIVCDVDHASTAEEQTTCLDNARTGKVTSEPTLL